MRFLYIAYGSVCELETQTMLSGDLGYIEKERLQKLRDKIAEVERMLKALIKTLKKTLEPLNPGLLGPCAPTNWRKANLDHLQKSDPKGSRVQAVLKYSTAF